MAGGGVSWLDLALYLIARYSNVEVAMQTARVNLINWHDIGQQPFARLFRRKVTLTPAAYRRRFSAMRRELQGPE